MVRIPLIVLAAATALCLSVRAHAQSLEAQRPAFRTALANAEAGRLEPASSAALARHPLSGWLEFAALRHDPDVVTSAQARDFLRRHDGQAVAAQFRTLWLAALARRQDWPTFLAAWQPTDSVALQCAHLQARQATGRLDAAWTEQAQAIWRKGAKSLPNGCDPVFNVLATQGGLPAALRWERIEAAAAERQTGVMRSAARGLPTDEAALANDYAAFIDAVHPRALNWPKTDRSRRMAAHGLAKLAQSDPDTAERLLPQYADALGMGDTERGQVLYQIALWTVASYGPDSARRLGNVPESAYDERLHEWRVREAMSRGDWPAALAALRKMPPSQRTDSRWRYFEARMSEKTGDRTGAQRLFREAATSPTFHGFLAADRLGQDYALCAWIPRDPPDAKQAVARDPAIVRAMELWQLERPGWATAEWNEALSRFNDTQRRIAVEVARDNGWFDRAVFSLGRQPDEQRLYELRFPLHHGDTIRREAARHAIDPAWVAAEIRAESIFNPKARSGANAMGLMQVLPGTRGRSQAAGHSLCRCVQPVRREYQHRHRHGLPARDGGQVWRALCRHRRLQRRARTDGTLAVAAPRFRSRPLDRDDQLQGNARIRGARAGLQRDLRLAPQRQCVAGERPDDGARAGQAQSVHLPHRADAEELRPAMPAAGAT